MKTYSKDVVKALLEKQRQKLLKQNEEEINKLKLQYQTLELEQELEDEAKVDIEEELKEFEGYGI